MTLSLLGVAVPGGSALNEHRLQPLDARPRWSVCVLFVVSTQSSGTGCGDDYEIGHPGQGHPQALSGTPGSVHGAGA
jgi:hypothetical protein